MTTIILIHGINNENNSAERIEQDWPEIIRKTAEKMGKTLPADTKFKAAFYGQTLFEETENWSSENEGVVRMSANDGKENYVDSEIAELYRNFQDGLGLTDDDVMQYLDEGDDMTAVRLADGIHKKWLKAIVRAVENVVPTKGKYLARIFLKQAATYLHKPGTKEKIDDMVYDQVFSDLTEGDDFIVVSHSLGTIVSYALLRRFRKTLKTPLLMTLGSPLGIQIVKKRLGPPLVMLPNLKSWVNCADKEDFVALKPKLTKKTFGTDEIKNITNIDNGKEDAHSILRYLSHESVVEEILVAL